MNSSDKENFYYLLGIPETANAEEIKKAYRKLSLKYHPDRNPGQPDMVSKFQKINEAYEVLGDEQKREEYDMMNKNPFMKMGGGGHPDMGNMDEIFSNLFGMHFGGGGMPPMFHMGGFPPGMGGGGGPNIRIFRNGVPVNIGQQMQKPVPIIQTIILNMVQVLEGATIPVDIERWLIEHDTKMFEKETLYVNIPKGVDDNEIIMLRDKGNILADNCRGDVKLFIKIENNSGFERSGLDLLVHKNITLKESLCGFSFELKYINDKVYTINNTGGHIIPPEHRKVIPKLGLTREEHVGNLIILFHVQFPEKLEPEIIEKLKALL